MITAAQWVPRGFAAPFPQKYTLDEEEYGRIAELAKLQLEDAEDDLKEAQEEGSDEDNGAKLAEDDQMQEDTKAAGSSTVKSETKNSHTYDTRILTKDLGTTMMISRSTTWNITMTMMTTSLRPNKQAWAFLEMSSL
jgi:hypothetical protein